MRKITIEERADTPNGSGRLAARGQRGDTELAHVNPFEAMLLKALGGAGTRNPRTGLKQFYTSLDSPNYNVEDWYKQAFGREADLGGLEYWSGQKSAGRSPQDIWGSFVAAGNQAWEPYSGWSPWDTQITAADNNLLDLPTDIMPTNTSSSQDTQSSAQSSAQSSDQSSASTSYSGLPAEYQTQLLAAIMPQLAGAVSNMPGEIDKYTQEAFGKYQQMLNKALKGAIPLGINNLANRGILSSTAGEQILADINKTALMDTATRGYDTAMQAALLKAQIPTMLGQLAELGKTQTGASASTGRSSGTSTGTSTGASSSSGYSEDPTVMYRTLADLLRSLI